MSADKLSPYHFFCRPRWKNTSIIRSCRELQPRYVTVCVFLDFAVHVELWRHLYFRLSSTGHHQHFLLFASGFVWWWRAERRWWFFIQRGKEWWGWQRQSWGGLQLFFSLFLLVDWFKYTLLDFYTYSQQDQIFMLLSLHVFDVSLPQSDQIFLFRPNSRNLRDTIPSCLGSR